MAIGQFPRCDQPVPHLLELLVGGVLEKGTSFLEDRAVVVADAGAAVLGHLDQDSAPVYRVTDPSDETFVLESVDEGGSRRRGEAGSLAQFSGGLRAVDEPIEAAQVSRIEANGPAHGVVECLGAALIGLHRISGFEDQSLPLFPH